ncbi:MAG: hypothetical protein IPL86_17015 [Flavobacteriales bacterium]|nr:hypothetical protein [Flavobacteriales bacterium]
MITLKNSVTGEFGKASAIASRTVTAKKVLLDLTTITNEAAHSLVDTFQIWRTLAGGTVAFLVDEVANTTASYDDNNSDASISTNRTLPVGLLAYDVYPQDSHGFCIAHGTRIFAFDAPDYHDDTNANVGCARWSEVDPEDGPFPNAWPLKNFNDFLRRKRLRSAAGMGDFIAVFEDDDIWIWAYIDDPDQLIGNGRLEPMDVGRGAVTFKSVVPVDGDPYCMDRKGIYNYKGGQQVTAISEAVQGVFDRVNWSERAQISGTYDEERIYWFLPLDADTECRYALVLDRRSVQNGLGLRWWLYHLPMAARDCTSFVQGNSTKAKAFGHAGRRFASIITEEGYEHVIDPRALSDGAHPLLAFEDTTLLADDQTFGPTGGGPCALGVNDFAGLYVLFDNVLTPEPLLIQSSDATTFTLAAALAFDLPLGTPYKIGSIKTLWASGQIDSGGPQQIKRHDRVNMLFKAMPYEGAEVKVTTLHDRKGAFVAGKTSSIDEKVSTVQWQPGHVVKTGGRSGSSNAGGYARVPVMGEDARLVQVIVEENGYLPWELVGYYMDSQQKVEKK